MSDTRVRSIIVSFCVVFVSLFTQTLQFDIMVTEIRLLQEPNIIAMANFNISKHNQTHFLTNGEMEWKIPLDDTLRMDLSIFHLDDNNDFQEMGSERFHPLCSKLYKVQDEALFNDLKYASNIWGYKECPIPSGKFYVKEFYHTLDIKIPADWPLEQNIGYKLQIFKKNTVIGAIEAHLKIVTQ